MRNLMECEPIKEKLMKTEIVTVTYTGSAIVEVSPDVVFMDLGDAIKFERSGPMVGKMRVTFLEKEFFDSDNSQFVASGKFHEGDGPVRVGALPYRTTYICELLDESDAVIASSDHKGGGAVEPVKNAPKVNK
jgi:hypothetical protein